jgi:homoserine acetyltransferase
MLILAAYSISRTISKSPKLQRKKLYTHTGSSKKKGSCRAEWWGSAVQMSNLAVFLCCVFTPQAHARLHPGNRPPAWLVRPALTCC